MNEVKIFKQRPNAIMPTKADSRSAGWDLYACITKNDEGACMLASTPSAPGGRLAIEIKSKQKQIIHCGINVFMPDNFEMQIRSRSGLALKHNIFVLNQPGTIDQSYCKINDHEIKVMLMNLGDHSFFIEQGDRIAQAIFQELPQVQLTLIEKDNDWPEYEFDRIGGFGSSGT